MQRHFKWKCNAGALGNSLHFSCNSQLFFQVLVMKLPFSLVSPLALSALLAASTSSQAQNTAPLAIDNANQVATDDLGRTLPTYLQVGAPKANRVVGLFYWQWHTGLRAMPNNFDMVEYLKGKPYYKDFTAHPPGGPDFPTFYWAKPLFGYYRSTDPWVIRKHLVMLADAGVDFLYLDYTNSQVYDNELKAFMDVALDLKAQGVKVPKLTFFLNAEPDLQVEHLFKDWYQKPEYAGMWFQWNGKPLLMAPLLKNDAPFKDPTLIPAAQKFFTFRPTWAFHDQKTEPTKWRFLHGYNAPVALSPAGKPEQIVVGKSTGGPIWDNLKDGGVSAVEGKTYEEKDYAPDWTLPDRSKGVFFQNAWNRALKEAPPIVLVTGWNEWTASVWNTPGVVMLNRKTIEGQGHIVDEFNPQFNRDLEPMTGDYRDNYYWQFVANMRRYKGMKAPQKASIPQKIKVDGQFSEWKSVSPNFKDSGHDIANRNFDAQVPNIRYVNTSARNDIISCKVARDAKNVYFMAQTAAPLSASTGKGWMQLFLNTDRNSKTGWCGYDFLINRSRDGQSVAVERNIGNKWAWKKVGMTRGKWSGNSLEIEVPRALLGIKSRALTLDFKWADNALSGAPDAMDFYLNGDVAPNTRFNYRYLAAF
ncbi:hypothetical protein B1R32_10993 [Abditibacterium utsteinense]|uniref:Glycosyl hydrolase family 71 n=2 Tax=Abditibacterium utsteinense TaxID=1960156 RepID=A0A2S8SSG7_9BACT|nr:hypothetical protein B1R32_10993 [Abditibacterium utsteinense]